MKFSEAMLLGLPEIHFINSSWLERSVLEPDTCRGCLVGAALYSEGHRSVSVPSLRVAELWPWVSKIRSSDLTCQFCGYVNMLPSFFGEFNDVVNGAKKLLLLATHLANHYGDGMITAEQAADVFRKLEEKYDVVEESKELPAKEEELQYSCT